MVRTSNEAGGTTTTSTRGRRRQGLWVAVVVFLALVAVGAAAGVATARVVDEQEQRLQAERADELVAVLASALTGNERALRVLIATGAASTDAATFEAAAQAVLNGSNAWVAIAQRQGTGLVIRQAQGTGLGPGEQLTGDREALARRALEGPELVTDIVDDDGSRALAFAVAGPFRQLIALLESPLGPPVAQAASQPASVDTAFDDLRGALYAAPTADPARVVLQVGELPADGEIERRTFPVGDDTWFLEMTTAEPLVGRAAKVVPWVIFAGGIVTGALVAGLVLVLARRRAYALSFADERTAELRAALQSLDETRAALEQLLVAGDTAVLRIATDGRVEYASSNMQRLFGIEPGAMTTDRDLLGRVHADDRDAVAAALQGAQGASPASTRLDVRLSDPDGGHTWTSMLVVPEPRPATEDRPPAVLVYVTDVDELRRTELELHQREATLSAVLAASPDIVTITDAEGTIRSASAASERLLGYPVDMVAGRRITEGVHYEDRATVEQVLASAMDGGEQQSVQYRARHRDGRWLFIESQIAPLRDHTGEANGLVVVSRDVTSRVELERGHQEARRAAEEANRAKSEFLSRMSHELRTPLNAVLGFGQLLELDDLTPEQRESVEYILKGGRHLLDLINEVLDISRIETGKLPLSPESVSVSELLAETTELIRPLTREKNVHLVVDATGCDCYMFADRQRVKQVLLNLLSNAVKYNRTGGTVALSCEADDSWVRVAVDDTGMGLRPDQLERLFTPFERLGAETTPMEGAGIGLALSLRLAEAMGGTIEVRSTLGQGSTFTVVLPRVEGPVQRFERLHEPVPAPPPAPVPESERAVLLHIEDNLSNVALVERVLANRPDIEVVAAMQGRLGLELARQHNPVMVLLDLHLPDMNGDQVLLRLRDDPLTARIPVVIVSADATPNQVQRLLAAGATAYLTKPLSVRDLLARIDDALAQRHQGNGSPRP